MKGAMKHFTSIVVILLLMLVTVKKSLAQQNSLTSSKCSHSWITLSLGNDFPLGKTQKKLDLSGSLTINFGQEWIWQIALQESAELALWGGEVTVIDALGVGRGYSQIKRWGRYAITGVPSIVWGKDFNYKSFTTVGLTLNGQMIFTPLQGFGFGIELFSNFNPKISTVGIRGLIMIGWRNKER